jgi:hypothetical protein
MIKRHIPVRVYWNYKHRCYSIFKAGAVRASAKSVRLENVELKVRESGRQKSLKENRKVVHAYAIGLLVDYVHPSEDRQLDILSGRRAFYNPYQYANFVDEDTALPIKFADIVQLDGGKMICADRQPLAA